MNSVNQLDLDSLLVGDLRDAWIQQATADYPDHPNPPAKARDLVEQALQAHKRVRDEYINTGELIPGRYATAEITSAKVLAWATRIATNWLYPVPVRTGPSLVLSGPTGRGKTHHVYAVRRAFHDLGLPASWTITTASDLNGTLRKFDGTDATDFARAALLVLDDLGSAAQTGFNDDNLYRIVNYRYEQELPTLITTNIPLGNIDATFGERIGGRLREMCDAHMWSTTDRDWRAR